LEENTMKKNIYIFALSALLGATAAIGAPQEVSAPTQQNQTTQADGSRPHGHRQADPQKQAQRLAKRLQLTSDQQNQLLPILAQRADQAKALRNDASLSATDRRAKMRDLRQESDAQIRNILTDSQKQQYDAMLQQARGRMKQHGAGTGSAS
jgi:Spy/CpxP family protein refolding chaperone